MDPETATTAASLHSNESNTTTVAVAPTTAAPVSKRRRPMEIAGFPEFTIEIDILMEKIKRKIKQTYELFGYHPIDTRITEEVSILEEKGIDSKEVFCLGMLHKGKVQQRNETQETHALRFDLTVPLARYVGQNEKSLQFPFKRYHIGKVYRGETSRAALGRFCEFYQSDIDVIGNEKLDLMYDAEFPVIIYHIFKNVIGIERFIIRINNRKFLEGLFQEFEVTDSSKIKRTVKIIDNMEKVKLEDTLKHLDEVGVNKIAAESIFRFFNLCQNTPINAIVPALRQITVKNALLKEGIDEVCIVFENIIASGIPLDNIMFDPSIARGLDYYTGTTYETVLIDHPELGSVCSGGRYDELVGTLSSNPNMKYPGCGISIGLTRLIPALVNAKTLKTEGKTTAKVLVTMMDRTRSIDYQKIATELRNAGINTSLYCNNSKLKTQLNYADKVGFNVVIVANAEALDSGKIQIKDMWLNAGKADKSECAENTALIDFDQMVNVVNTIVAKNQTKSSAEVSSSAFRTYSENSIFDIIKILQGIVDKVLVSQEIEISYQAVDLTTYVNSLGKRDKSIMWYVGARGVRDCTTKFYKPIIDKIIENGSTTYLLDFSAWATFIYAKATLDKRSDFKDTKFTKMIYASEFFEHLDYILKDSRGLQLFKDIMSRPEIFEASKNYQATGIKVKDIFPETSEVRKVIDIELDSSKVYSCFQYVEIMYIIEKIVNTNPTLLHNIHFILPNDELKYYPQNLLKRDLENFLMNNFISQINIHFAIFTFENGTTDRPYNVGKRI